MPSRSGSSMRNGSTDASPPRSQTLKRKSSRETDMRIALIHALKHSLVPIEASFARLWPEETLMNLPYDSLSPDLSLDGRFAPAITDRFLALGQYADSPGANPILFTCSAFGPCIEA